MVNKDIFESVWLIADVMRGDDIQLTFNNFLEMANSKGLEINYDMLRIFDQRINRSGNFITDEESTYLISKIASIFMPKRILNPACGTGSLFSEISTSQRRNSEFIGIDVNLDILKIPRNIFKDKNNFNFINGDFFNLGQDIGKFDLILCDPPQGRLNNSYHGSVRTQNIGDAFLLSSLDYLNENGHLLFLVQDSFFYRSSRVKKYVLDNYGIEAAISLSKGTYKNVKKSLIIIKKDIQPLNVFLAKLDDKKSADIITDNFFHHKSTNNILQGHWINSNKITYDNVWTLDYFRGLDTLKNKKSEINHSFKHLYEIADIKRQFDESDAILLIPRFLRKEVIFIPELELNERNNYDKQRALNPYFQCKVNDKNILPQYLKIFLNSELGKYQRRLFSSGSTLEEINIRGIQSLNIAIPDFKAQKKIIEADQKITEWYNETFSLYERFKNKIFNYEDILGIISNFEKEDEIELKSSKKLLLNNEITVNSPIESDKSNLSEIKHIENRNPLYDGLLWPLATSYISATKGTSEPVEKALNFFNLFELVAAFNSIVLLSSLPKEVYLEHKDEIWGNGSFRKVGFGHWVGLYRGLSKIFQNNDMDLIFDDNFYKKISSPKIINIIDPIPNKRNNRVLHNGVISRVNAERTISELNPYINDVFKILGAYNKFWLIYTESMIKVQEMYQIRVQKLNGACYPFLYDTIATNKDMDSNSLYLYNPITDERLKLKDNFIKFIQCEECSHWSLYIYNKFKNNKAIYVSYQTEQHNLKISNVSFEDLFD